MNVFIPNLFYFFCFTSDKIGGLRRQKYHSSSSFDGKVFNLQGHVFATFNLVMRPVRGIVYPTESACLIAGSLSLFFNSPSHYFVSPTLFFSSTSNVFLYVVRNVINLILQ